MVKEEQKRQSIRVEVLEDGLTSLTREVAHLREEMDARFDAVDRRFDAVDRRFDTLEAQFNVFQGETNGHFAELHKLIADGNAAIISAVMTLGRK